MSEASLQSYLTSVIEQALESPTERKPKRKWAFGPIWVTKSHHEEFASRIAKQLIDEAIASGLPLSHAVTDLNPLSGGNTAELVAQLTLHAPFVFKLDQRQEKLAKEGELMRAMKSDSGLPARFRDAWPVIYAIRGKPPFAYLMEHFPEVDGWSSLADRLYARDEPLRPSAVDAVRLLNAALDILFEGYEASRTPRALPNLGEDYVARISGRLQDACDFDARFASQPLAINRVPFEPWQSYLDLINGNEAYLASITPPFSTVAHGDPNPGNLLLRMTTSEVELKLIDPKDWFKGDYLFDIAKITHFLEGTGPIEHPASGAALELVYADSSGSINLTYSFGQPSWTGMLVEACLARVEQFALSHGDVHWRARYELGMASNLLGLPIGRLTHRTRPDSDVALALYGEGLKWLARFCNRLRQPVRCMHAPVLVVSPAMVEPEPVARARKLVREAVPHVVETEDRRGFLVLQWTPARENEADKPVELSLEHEARLKPTSRRILAELQSCLSQSEGRSIREFLLTDGSCDDRLIVRRHRREHGAQSLDRYFELKDADASEQLIARMIALRERIRTRAFMSWTSSADTVRPLNLELPNVALGDSGVVARLEFNWIDDLALSVADFRAPVDDRARLVNPLHLASLVVPIQPSDVEPVLEHTTYREKYSLVLLGEAGAPEQEVYHLNIDHVVAQSLKTSTIGTYIDVDIAPCERVGEDQLASLIELASALSRQFALVPVGASKAWRDAVVVGDLR